jgi:hypothetical protein
MDLVELLQREIQDWKMKYSKMLVENVNLRGFKSIVMNNPTKYSKSGTCVTAEMKKDRIGHNGPPESIFDEERKNFKDGQAKIKELELSLANALEVNESHRKLNGKLQERLTEVEEDNKKLAHQIENRVNKMRKSGL